MGMTLGVIGTGNMGSALVKGWLRAPEPGLEILVWDKIKESAFRLLTPGPVSLARSLEDLVRNVDVLFVVVKPKDALGVLTAVAPFVRKDQTIVSSMAGVHLKWLRKTIGPGPALYRIMPNLGVELGVGVVALSSEPNTPDVDMQSVIGLFDALGICEVVPEKMLDAVTAVSGTGPGFLALALESLEDGAVAVGLPRAMARAFVRQTAVTTAQLLSAYSESPAELIEQTTSHSEVDSAGMEVLIDREVRDAFQHAVEAAMERSRHLQEASSFSKGQDS